MTYVRTLKRIRQDKTNYRKRAALVLGRHSFVTIKVSDQNVISQLLKPSPTGDIVLASAHSRELVKNGWKGSLNSLPACYLTGLLLGTKALAKGTTNAVLYIGKDKFTSRVAACLKGLVEAGVNLPHSEDSLPDDERITGKHIADYASSLKESEADEYNYRFSTILKNGLNPEDYPTHFEQLRLKISGKPPKAKAQEVEGRSEEELAKKAKGAKKEPKSKGKSEGAKKESKKEKKGGSKAK